MDEISDANVSLVVNLFYDASPNRVRFGGLQSQLQPRARHPALVPSDRPGVEPQWKSVDLDTYRKITGKTAPLNFGTVELLAQGAFVHCMFPKTGRSFSFQCFCRPSVLQACTGSCLTSALELECGEVSAAGAEGSSNQTPPDCLRGGLREGIWGGALRPQGRSGPWLPH
eukprot:2946582-Pyramimonas_sp.AAC.1